MSATLQRLYNGAAGGQEPRKICRVVFRMSPNSESLLNSAPAQPGHPFDVFDVTADRLLEKLHELQTGAQAKPSAYPPAIRQHEIIADILRAEFGLDRAMRIAAMNPLREVELEADHARGDRAPHVRAA